MGTPPRFSAVSSLSLSLSATEDSQSAIIRPRNCPEHHFLTPFCSPSFYSSGPFYAVPITHLPAASNHPSATRRPLSACIVVQLHREICTVATGNRTTKSRARTEIREKGRKRVVATDCERTSRCRGIANASADRYKALQTMPEDLDSWRDQNGWAYRRNPPFPFRFLRMYATRFWFYGREWPEKRSSENKKKVE